MPKIVYVIDQLLGDTGGTEKQLILLLNKLTPSDFDIRLVCLRPTEFVKKHSFNFKIETYNIKRNFGLNYFRYLFKFKKYCRQEKIDIVQTFFFDANLFGLLGAKLAGVKIKIASRRNMGYDLTFFRRIMLILLSPITEYYMANSKTVSDYFSKRESTPSSKQKVIHNGLLLEKFDVITDDYKIAQRKTHNINPDKIVIGMVANLRPIKNYSAFVEAAKKLNEKYNNLLFIVVGVGPEESKIKNQIKKYNLDDKFRFMGEVYDIIPILALFDIGVQSSMSESFSNTIMEYMAAGMPSVVSDAGGNAEVLNGHGGYIYDKHNPDQLGQNISMLLNNKDLRSKLGADAKSYAYENYNHYSIIMQYENFYKSVLA